MKKNNKGNHENCDDDDLLQFTIHLEDYLPDGIDIGDEYDDDDDYENYEDDDEDNRAEYNNGLPFSMGLLKNIYANNNIKNVTEDPLTWVKPWETVTIHDRVISKGFIYMSQTTSMWKLIDTPSVINEKYKVSPSKYTFKHTKLDNNVKYYMDTTLLYSDRYAELSRKCKGLYLDWLASSRQDPNTPIGYVRLYFSGLENRIINNSENKLVSNDEYLEIYHEVARLNKTYSHDQSFALDTKNFLGFLSLMRYNLFNNNESNYPYEYRLAKTVHEKRPINAELAWEWLSNSREIRLPRTSLRYEDELKQLFTIYYTKKFKNGLIVKPNKKRLTVVYRLSFNYLPIEADVGDLPDPSNLKAPMNKLNPIIMTCLEELKKYSRYLGKAGHTKDDIHALMLLPKVLLQNSNSPTINELKKWTTKIITKKNGIVPFLDLWKLLKLPTPKAVNKRETTLIQALFDHIGVNFAPDIRFHDEKIQLNGNLVLFNPLEGKPLQPSGNLITQAIIINLSLMMSPVDVPISKQKKQILTNLINYNNDLSTNEKLSLHAYFKWRIHTPMEMKALKAKLKNVSDHAKDLIKDIIISLVIAEGRIDPTAIQKLEKLYTALGFEKSLALRDLHNNHSSKIKHNHHASPHSHRKTSKKNAKFSLDEKSLATHEEETKKSQLMLDSIFTDDNDNDNDNDNDSNHNHEEKQAQDNHSPGLSDNYLHFYKELSIKETWNRIDVEKKAKKFNLMIDGALEIINDWAYDMVDAPVIDDDGDIYIDLDIVEELKQN